MVYKDESGRAYYVGGIARGQYMIYYKDEEDVRGHIYAGPYACKERAEEALTGRAHAYGWRKAVR